MGVFLPPVQRGRGGGRIEGFSPLHSEGSEGRISLILPPAGGRIEKILGTLDCKCVDFLIEFCVCEAKIGIFFACGAVCVCRFPIEICVREEVNRQKFSPAALVGFYI